MNKQYNKVQLIMEICCGAVIAGIILYVGFKWTSIPQVIPIHFGINGQPDGYGGKGNILVLLFVCAGVYGLISFCQRFPQTWNIPVKITEQNREKVYSIVKTVIIALKLEVTVILAYITTCSATFKPLKGWFVSAELIIVFITVFTGMYRCIKV